ncbi:Oidioi.mRNA.OKI2018_I69.chr2.g8241.t1.cds [Oikopleura dioica]|uniref:Oidioi.mRNA.OKI2018_I69.chr2.g8241.t1.cds n=1 Tax=Oikopleura dioica TaxID=34765 RepID=A0ABN7T9L9_OIKDI|nr:Oidioi.mRNA.OKI2018_I69.chr2.g8241.t1.cds [Oikopleura dioica]
MNLTGEKIKLIVFSLAGAVLAYGVYKWQSPKEPPKKEDKDPSCPMGSGKSAEQRFTEALAEQVERIQIIQPKTNPDLENWTSLLRCLLILCVLILISSLFTRCLPL